MRMDNGRNQKNPRSERTGYRDVAMSAAKITLRLQSRCWKGRPSLTLRKARCLPLSIAVWGGDHDRVRIGYHVWAFHTKLPEHCEGTKVITSTCRIKCDFVASDETAVILAALCLRSCPSSIPPT